MVPGKQDWRCEGGKSLVSSRLLDIGGVCWHMLSFTFEAQFTDFFIFNFECSHCWRVETTGLPDAVLNVNSVC